MFIYDCFIHTFHVLAIVTDRRAFLSLIPKIRQYGLAISIILIFFLTDFSYNFIGHHRIVEAIQQNSQNLFSYFICFL